MLGAEEIVDKGEEGALAKEDAAPEITPEEDALQAKETLRDMIAGIVACAVLIGAAGGVIAGGSRAVFLLGLLLGCVTAGLMLWHMYVTIDRALDMDSDSAAKYTKKCVAFRLLMAAAAFAAAGLLPGLFHVFGVLLGILCLKFSAYLQPLTHIVLKNLSKGR